MRLSIYSYIYWPYYLSSVTYMSLFMSLTSVYYISILLGISLIFFFYIHACLWLFFLTVLIQYVSVFYCCVSKPHTQCLETTQIYYLTISLGTALLNLLLRGLQGVSQAGVLIWSLGSSLWLLTEFTFLQIPIFLIAVGS